VLHISGWCSVHNCNDLFNVASESLKTGFWGVSGSTGRLDDGVLGLWSDAGLVTCMLDACFVDENNFISTTLLTHIQYAPSLDSSPLSALRSPFLSLWTAFAASPLTLIRQRRRMHSIDHLKDAIADCCAELSKTSQP
jgi:hypothetical protein